MSFLVVHEKRVAQILARYGRVQRGQRLSGSVRLCLRMAGAPLRRLECHLRHPARPHAGSGQAGRGASSARALVAARFAVPDCTRLGETLPLPAPDGSGALVVALDLRTYEAARSTWR